MFCLCIFESDTVKIDCPVQSSIPVRSHTFTEIYHEIISTAILLLSADSRRVVIPRQSRRDIVLAASVRPFHPSVRATDMDLRAFLVVWRLTRGHFLTKGHGPL